MQWSYTYAVVFIDFYGVTKKKQKNIQAHNELKWHKHTHVCIYDMFACNITIKKLSGGVPPFVVWAEVLSEWYHTICSSATLEKYIHHAWLWMIMIEHSMVDYIFNTQPRGSLNRVSRSHLTNIWIGHYKGKTVVGPSHLYNGNPHNQTVFIMKQDPASHLESILTLDSGIVVAKTFWQTNSPVTRGIIKHSKIYLPSFKHGIVAVSLLNQWLLGDIVIIEKCNFWIYMLQIKFVSTCVIALMWMAQNSFGDRSLLV